MNFDENLLTQVQIKIKDQEIDINAQIQKIDDLQQEISNKHSLLKKINNESQQIHQETNKICDENYRLSSDIDCKEKLIESENKIVNEKLKRQKELKKKFYFLKETNDDLKQQIYQMQEEMENSKTQIITIKDQIEATKNMQNKAILENEEIEKKSKILNEIAKEYELAKYRVINIEDEYESTTEKIIKLSNKVQKKKLKRKLLNKEYVLLQNKLRSIKKKIKKNQNNQENYEFTMTKEDILTQISNLTMQLENLRNQNKNLTSQIENYSQKPILPVENHKESSNKLGISSDIPQIVHNINILRYQIIDEDKNNEQILFERKLLNEQKNIYLNKIRESQATLANLEQERKKLETSKTNLLFEKEDVQKEEQIYSFIQEPKEIQKTFTSH